MMQTLKGAAKSVTMWFNGIFATVATAIPFALDSFPALEQYLPTNIYKHLMVALIVGNMVLRFRTSKPLAEK